MAAIVEWDNEDQTVLRTTYQEPIAIEDVYAALEQQVAILDAVDYPITLLIDLSALKQLPNTSLSNYPQIAKHRGMKHPNTAMSYVIMNNLPIEYMVNIFSRMFAKFETATSLEQARKRIAEQARL